ncbi:unnamed protein product [Symbiodinium microadriaticum]|nr:unnamed protein product [Symbiodinium microadriaticum]
MGTLLETVWWVKVEFEMQAQRLSQMEETLERQAARIATLEAREPLAASPKKPVTEVAVSSSKAVDLLGLDPFERASEPQATARKDWADVEDDDDNEAYMPADAEKVVEGPLDGSRQEDPWLEAAAMAKRGTSFLDKPAAPAAVLGAKKAAAPQPKPSQPSQAPRPGLLECPDSSVASVAPAPASRPKARSKPEVSEELMAKLMQAVHSKKLMEPVEGPPQPSNGSNGTTTVPKKAPPAALQAASKVMPATKSLPAAKPKPKGAPPILREKWPPKPPIVRFRAQCEFSAQFKPAEVKEERRRSIQQAQERKQIKIDAQEVIQDMTLTWINMYFKLDVVTPRDLTASFSIIILTMMDVIYPKKVRWHQVDWNVAYMRALAHNHRMLEKHWNEVNMDKVKDLRRDRIGMSIENTLDASIEDKLHFLKQVKRWFDCRVQHSAAYDPIKRRTEVEKQIRLTGRLMKFPTWMQYDKEEVQASRATKPDKNKRRSEQTEPTTEYEKMPEFKRLLWFLGSEHQTM